jgi:cytochrome c biogenesis protein CcmG/thiol:disulfide interchange protein DsbE
MSETQKPNYWVFLPIALFVALAGVFASQLLSGKDSALLPSALIGKPAPQTSLPPLQASGLPGINTADFKGRVTVLNVFASWCVPCRQEHPLLLELAKDKRFVLVGFNYKDEPANAAKFLSELGNPYAALGTDVSGRSGIDWGIYGVPETYVINKSGLITYKQIGPLSPASLANALMPEIEKALVSK